MISAHDPISIALRVGRAIESVGGEYFVGGSLASSLQGDPRSTNDVDIVLSLPISKVDELAIALGPDFEIDRDILREALARGTSANGFFIPVLTKIDFFGVGRTEFDESEFSRRKPMRVGAVDEILIVKAPEDTVLRKLLWHREGGGVSQKQWHDIVAVLRVSGSLMDATYLRGWARRLGLEGALDRAEADAQSIAR